MKARGWYNIPAMDWIVLSPHLDDAVLSCGGWIHQRVQAGDQVEIFTICAGDAPAGAFSLLAEELHARWGSGVDATALRRAEDLQACQQLGAFARHFNIPDCIYRRNPTSGSPLIERNQDLFQPLPDVERPLVESIAAELAGWISAQCLLVSPLTLGGHIDHHLTRAAAEQTHRPLLYYADYPYLLQDEARFTAALDANWKTCTFAIPPASLAAWQNAIACYRSQISTFWQDEAAMRAAIEHYWRRGGGGRLWGYNLPQPLNPLE